MSSGETSSTVVCMDQLASHYGHFHATTEPVFKGSEARFLHSPLDGMAAKDPELARLGDAYDTRLPFHGPSWHLVWTSCIRRVSRICLSYRWKESGCLLFLTTRCCSCHTPASKNWAWRLRPRLCTDHTLVAWTLLDLSTVGGCFFVFVWLACVKLSGSCVFQLLVLLTVDAGQHGRQRRSQQAVPVSSCTDLIELLKMSLR